MKHFEIKISPEFKAQTTKAIVAILLFVLTYLILLFLAGSLSVLCVYAALMLITSFPKLITIVLGIGLAGLGVIVLLFLIKFIFKSHKIDRSHLREIKRADEPQLFELIDDIVKKVGTSFPKKVYLSSDVNASVFYDSGFWSMFFPVRKNLQIGLGLVNSLTKSELTAVLSHEFGHFSQKTMKVGSYVYNVNQVIYNLLYDNESYEDFIQTWASISNYFAIFVFVAKIIIEFIQWILKLMYELINVQYMGLSREMEFQADEIAANITGFEPLKTALLRLSFADFSFNSTVAFYERKIAEKQKTDNIFRDHFFAMKFLAGENKIEIKNAFPCVTEADFEKYNNSKLLIKDQWASHPRTEDRIARLEQTALFAEKIDFEPANTLFFNIEKLQGELTEKMFKNVQYKGETVKLSAEKFQNEFVSRFSEDTFPKIYKGYYDNKNLFPINLQETAENAAEAAFEDLFSDEIIELLNISFALQKDIEKIVEIDKGEINVKSFDYDGIKYKKDDISLLLPKLYIELERVLKKIKENDFKIYNFFINCEKESGKSLVLESLYDDYFRYDAESEKNYALLNEVSRKFQMLFGTSTIEQLNVNSSNLKESEAALKQSMKEILEDEKFQPVLTKEIRDSFDLYLSKDWDYMGTQMFFEGNITVGRTAINNYAQILSQEFFYLKKKILAYQAELYLAHKKMPSSFIKPISE